MSALPRSSFQAIAGSAESSAARTAAASSSENTVVSLSSCACSGSRSGRKNRYVYAIAGLGSKGLSFRAEGEEPRRLEWPRSLRSAPLRAGHACAARSRSEEHTSELQSLRHLVCRLLLEK